MTNTDKNSISAWVSAARLRTLPLAFSCILLGSFLAGSQGFFSWSILILCLLTTLFYQVLSNFSNDLGDGLKGTDDHRQGEARAVASGAISISQMKIAVWIFASLSFVSGTVLSLIATKGLSIYITLFFITLGAFAVWSAMSYTMGKKAYGYAGFGDVFVLIFFGYVGVLGPYFLQSHRLDIFMLLPATSVGLLATGVLNLNNTRDIENDLKHGKMSIPARIGRQKAKIYQLVLIITSVVLSVIYTTKTTESTWGYLWTLSLPLIALTTIKLFQTNDPLKIDKLLKPLAISTLLYSILFGVGFWVA